MDLLGFLLGIFDRSANRLIAIFGLSRKVVSGNLSLDRQV